MKDAHRHPLSDDDQVELPIVVVVDPRRRRNHSRVGQSRRLLESDIGEAARAVVLQQVALWYQPVTPRDHSASHEQIRMAVAVEVSDGDRRSILEEIRQSVLGAREVAAAIVHVQPVAELFRVPPELVASAHDEQVGMSVAIRVEERRVHILVHAVRGNRGLTTRSECPVSAAGERVFPAATWRRRRRCRPARHHSRRLPPAPAPRSRAGAASAARDCNRRRCLPRA